MRFGSALLIVALLAMLAGVGWFAYSGLSTGTEPMPAQGIVALVAGVILSLVIGVCLMVLVFYSSRKGYDEPPRPTDNEDA